MEISAKTIHSQLLVLDFTASNRSEFRTEKRRRGLSWCWGIKKLYWFTHLPKSSSCSLGCESTSPSTSRPEMREHWSAETI